MIFLLIIVFELGKVFIVNLLIIFLIVVIVEWILLFFSVILVNLLILFVNCIKFIKIKFKVFIKLVLIIFLL